VPVVPMPLLKAHIEIPTIINPVLVAIFRENTKTTAKAVVIKLYAKTMVQ
ncbi:Multidrug resistance protein fnx1, partial [Pyrenophora tritici-repentis]